MRTVLVADDDGDDLAKMKEILEQERYLVVTASTPEAAMDLLKPEKIGVAIIDYRLTTGDLDDKTGLLVAQNSSREIPKIMISGMNDKNRIMEAFGADSDGRVIVFEFLSKAFLTGDKPDDQAVKSKKLLEAVKRAFDARLIWERRERESVKGQLLSDYKVARRFDLVNTIVSFLVNITFVVLIVNTVRWIHAGEAGIVLSSIICIGIIVTEVALNLFLAKRIEGSARRAESYHDELIQAWRFEQLLKSTENLDPPTVRNQTKREIISSFANRWNSKGKGIPASKEGELE